MASFIMALNINPNAQKLHADLSHHINKSFDVFADNSVPLTNLFATLGRYDYIAVFDAVDQNAAFKIASEINSKGILETETWPVIPYEDYTKLMR